MMLRSINKSQKILFYIFILIFLSTLNNFNLTNYYLNFFKIKKITILGLNENQNQEIFEELDSLINKNLFLLKEREVSKKLKSLNYIESFTVTKKYPSEIKVLVKKVKIIGQTVIDGKKNYLGSNGKFIKKVNGLENVPNVFGSFKIEELINFNNLLIENNFNLKLIKNYYFFNSKRWDIEFNDILIRLPSKNLPESINLSKKIIEKYPNKKIIDLRVSNQVIISNEQ